MAQRVRRRQDDNRTPRSADPPLRHRRNWKRQLALQEPSRRSRANPRSRRLRNPDQLRRRERYLPKPPLEGVKIGRRLGAHCLTRNVTEELSADDWSSAAESG